MFGPQLNIIPSVNAFHATGQTFAISIPLQLPYLLPNLIEVGLVLGHLQQKTKRSGMSKNVSE